MVKITPLPLRNGVRASSRCHERKRTKIGLSLALSFLVFVAVVNTPWSNETRNPLRIQHFPLSDRDLGEIEKNAKEFEKEAPLGLGSLKTTFLLGIFSTNASEKYINRRTYIRETYLTVSDPRICKLNEYIRQIEENGPHNTVCQIPYAFIIAAGGNDRPYDHDDDAPLTVKPWKKVNDEDDCVYLNIRESMEDGKSPSYFKFGADVARKYHIDYITKLDDDTLISPDSLMNFIEDELPPAPYNRRIYGGRSWSTRSGAVFYGAGQFYFMSSDLAHYVGNVLSAEDRKSLSHSKKTEDADMGRFVFSHPQPIKFMDLVMYKFWIHDSATKIEEDFRTKWKDHGMDNFLARERVPWSFYCSNWLGGRGL